MKLNKSILRVMKENYGQYIGMLYMVILSVFLFVGLTITAQNLRHNKNEYVKNNVQGDLEIYTADNISNISDIEKKFDLKMGESLIKEYKVKDSTIRFFTPNTKVNIPGIIEGKMPKAGEIAIDPLFAKANNLKVGDIYHMNNSLYKISGFVGLPNYAYIIQKDGDLINNAKKFGIGIMSKEDMKEGMHLYSVKYNNEDKDVYDQSKELKSYLNKNNTTILDFVYAKHNMKISTLDIEAIAISTYSVVLPTIILFITVVLISIVLGRNIKSEMANIGTLYALGYRKKEIIKHYMNYPILLSVVGGIIGGILGMLAVKPIFGLFMNYFPIPIDKFSYYPIYFVLGIAVCLVFLYMGSYLAINKVLSMSPVSLMKKEGKIKKVKPIERKLKLDKFKFKTKFSIREQLRSIPRITFLVYGVAIATVFLMYGFVAKSSMDYMINQEGNDTFEYKYEYILKQPTNKAPIGGEAINGMKFVLKDKADRKFEVIGASENSKLVTLKDKKGNKIDIKNDEFVISSTMAKKYKVNVGDKLSFINISDDKEYSITITQICETNVGDYVFTSLDTFNELMNIKGGYYNAIISKTPLNIDKDLVYMSSTPSSIKNMLGDYLGLMNAFIYGIAVVAFVIGVIIVYIIASISIDENKNHISLMKVFGYRKREINSMMLNSSRKYVVLGYAIGVPSGYFLVKLIFKIFEAMNINFEVHLDWQYVVIAFVIIALVFEASKMLCIKKVEKISLSESLKAQRE